MGVAISTMIPNQETAGPVASVVFFVLLFLSGLWFPLPANSGLAKFSSYFPVRHLINAVNAPFELQRGVSPWAGHDLLIIALWGEAPFSCPSRIPVGTPSSIVPRARMTNRTTRMSS